MSEEFFILFVAHAIVDQYQAVAFLNQQAAQGPAAHIILVGGIEFIPDAFGDYAEHGATVKLEVAGVDGIKVHVARVLMAGHSF
jgi:hypothetical protein